MGHFSTAIHFCTFLKPHFWAPYDSWGYPEPKYEPDGEGVTETPIVLKGLTLNFLNSYFLVNISVKYFVVSL